MTFNKTLKFKNAKVMEQCWSLKCSNDIIRFPHAQIRVCAWTQLCQLRFLQPAPFINSSKIIKCSKTTQLLCVLSCCWLVPTPEPVDVEALSILLDFSTISQLKIFLLLLILSSITLILLVAFSLFSPSLSLSLCLWQTNSHSLT